MSNSILLRASAMPTAFKCAGSVQPCEIDIDEVNESAETGTSFHECARSLASKGEIEWNTIDQICDTYDGNSEEVRMLCGKASKLWPLLRETFPCALTEIAVQFELPHCDVAGLTLTGHIDLIAIVGSQARLLDWKTGRKDANYSQQMHAYMAMVLLSYPQLDGATATIVWVRAGDIENYSMTRAQALAWIADFEQRIVNWDGVFRTGDHCVHCRRKHECQAGNKLARSYVAAVNDIDLDSIESQVLTLEPDKFIELYHKARFVSQIAERVLKTVKKQVDAKGEVVGSETKLYLDSETRRELVPEKAWPVLEEIGFTEEDFAAVIKMPIGKVEKRVAELAGKGNGAAAKRALAAKLELAGAIEINETYKLEERRVLNNVE